MPLDERVLTPRESMIVAAGASPAFVTVTADGPLDIDVLGHALRLLAEANPILRSEIVRTGDERYVLRVDDHTPSITVRDDGTTFADVVNTPWDAGERTAQLLVLRESRGWAIVLAVHHAVADGQLITTLLRRLVEYYTALVSGARVAVVRRDELDPPLEEVLRRMGAVPASAEPVQDTAPEEVTTLAPGSVPAAGRPSFGIRNLRLGPEATARFISAAKAHRLSVSSLVVGAMTVALRGMHDSPDPLTLALCLQVDLRSRMTPPVPPDAAMSAVGSVIINLPTPYDAGPVEVGTQVDSRMPGAVRQALRQAALLAAGKLRLSRAQEISISISNLGRLSFPSVAGDLRFGTIRSVATMPFMRVPALVVNTTNGSLNLDLIYNRAFLTDDVVHHLTQGFESRLAALARTGASSSV
ncbi:phthiocerol/phthiodiolone dimycocerosyl transferase family protein [Actinoplanes flavus]|uniref:Phthiocerol/phthiodiolone dimycocerosyl transferase n=1 Tax=Actinoplanes flavus TaxID=2820290 RepID=A0ABS3URF6_9ACTN|nr:hypothetical protein [Actinoplanes flavus]MBO3741359.1 hypothetical protein [Actinoplanes flavus]